ncbi:MAG: metalloregulator ArsR/SmtB family transcription factor [candidate division Zixibacteria bacterium]|nr:metalloregulator ArsR/SmtB family transcription factor [candidate division Zixibacteria bacterium]
MPKRKKDVCEIFCYNKKLVDSLKREIIGRGEIAGLSSIFDVLSDQTRLKMIYLLSKRELCVCDLANVLNLSISAVSHQLRRLRDLRLVKFRSEGKMAFYSLEDSMVKDLFKSALSYVQKK